MCRNSAYYETNADPPSFKIKFVDNQEQHEQFIAVISLSGNEKIFYAAFLFENEVSPNVLEPEESVTYCDGMDDPDNHGLC